MNPMLRFDAAIARALSTQFKNSKPGDFMPWPREDQQEPATPEQILAFLTTRVKTKD